MIPSPDPWAILGLDRAASTEREVKRAYARLLKQHRPDQDPEGFQRVNEAYQEALRELRETFSGEGQFADSPADGDAGTKELVHTGPPESAAEPGQPADPSDPSEPSKSGPPPLRPESGGGDDSAPLPGEFLSGHRRLLAGMGMPGPGTALRDFQALRDMVRGDPAALASSWVTLLEQLFQSPDGLKLLPELQAQDALLLMRHGQENCAARLLMTWREDVLLLNRLTQLANLMLEGRTGNDPALLRAMHFTARMAAFHLPHISGRLADELYRQSSPGVRDQIVRDIEMRAAAGKLFAGFSLPERRVWEHQLFETGDSGVDWSSPEAMSALQSVIAGCGQNWEGWPLVTQVVPEDLLNRTLAQVRLAQAGARPRAKRDWLPSGRWAFALLWLTAHLVSSVFKEDNKDRSLPPPSRLNAAPSSFQRAMDTMPEGPDKIPPKPPGSLPVLDDLSEILPAAPSSPPPDSKAPGSASSTTSSSSSSSGGRLPSLDYSPTDSVAPSLNLRDSLGK